MPAREVARSSNVEAIQHAEAFVYHLLALYVARRTGVMTVRTETSTVDIYLREGTPVFAERDTLGGSLSLDLLREGILSSQQYEAIVSRMTTDLFESEQMRFAEVAIELGFLSHEQVNVQLEAQVRQTVVECMASKDVEVTFRVSLDALGPVANYPCPVQPMVLSGVKQYYDWVRTQGVWGPDADAFARLKVAASETATLYALKPDERRYISGIDGSKTVSQLIQGGALDVLHSSQLMASLLLTEGVELYSQPPPPDEPIASLLPPVTLVESAATRRRLSSPLLQAVRATDLVTVHVSERPPAASPVSPPAVVPASQQATTPKASSQVAKFLQQGTHDASTFPSELVAGVPDQMMPESQLSEEQRSLKAEKMFGLGKRLLKTDALSRAARSFATAERLQPAVTEYALYAKWTEFLVHPPEHSDSALEALGKLALMTLKGDKHHAYAYYVYGRVAHARGDAETAKTALKNALRFDSSNLEAKTFLRVLTKH